MITNLYTIPDYAERVDCTRAYIYKLIKQGRLTPILEGKKKLIDPAEADPILKFREAGRETSKVSQKNGQKRTQETPSSNSELPSLSDDSSYDDLDRIKLYEQARKLRLENDLKEGILTNKAEIKDKLYKATRIIREALEALPARATPIVIGLSAHETEQALKKEVNKVLMNLSEEL